MDAWGCRFVTLFRAEIGDVVSEIIDFVVRSVQPGRPLVIEVIAVYSNRPKRDPLAMPRIVAEIIRESALEQSKRDDLLKASEGDGLNRETGYSSVHLILSRDVDVDLSQGRTTRTAKFEIQVRDVFEEAWSEISHRLAYKRRIAETAADNGQDPASRTVQSRGLNALFDRNMSYWLDTAGLEGKDLSVSAIDEDIKDLLKALPDAPSEVRAAIASGYGMLQAGHRSAVKSIDDRQATKFYETAAVKFAEVLGQIDGMQDNQVCASPPLSVEYYLRMEHAYALWRGAWGAVAINTVYQAVQIYEDLMKKQQAEGSRQYTDEVSIRLRSGQALSQMRVLAMPSREGGALFSEDKEKVKSWLQIASGHLQQALEMAETNPLLIGQEERKRWLVIEAERARGGEYRLAMMEDALDVRISALKAVVANAEVVADSIEAHVRYSNGFLASAHKCFGNVLFYHWELLRQERRQDSEIELDDGRRRQIQGFLERLDRKPFKRLIEMHTETIDNMMVGAQMIGNTEQARLLARKNEQKFRAIAEARRAQEEKNQALRAAEVEITRHLDEGDETESYQRAVTVLNPLGGRL